MVVAIPVEVVAAEAVAEIVGDSRGSSISSSIVAVTVDDSRSSSRSIVAVLVGDSRCSSNINSSSTVMVAIPVVVAAVEI